MTREEAIAVLEESKRQNEIMRDNPSTFWASHQMAAGVNNAKRRIEALDVALSALRTVSREQVEKVWRGEWIIQEGEHSEFIKKCSKCGFPISGWWGADKFCAYCGAPMTDEAVQMVMERMEALNEM